MFNKTIADRVA